MTLEKKMKIVINNYFEKECSVNTSIREAFEKGFRIGVSKVQPKRGEWLINTDGYYPYCSNCEKEPQSGEMTDFCPNCGADMREKRVAHK